MKNKKVIAGMSLALVIALGSTSVFAATANKALADVPAPVMVRTTSTSLQGRMSEYQKVGIKQDVDGNLIYKNKVVRYLVEETTVNEQSTVSYQYLNENGTVDLKVIRGTVQNADDSKGFGAVSEVREFTSKEFDERNIEQVRKILNSMEGKESTPFTFNDDPSQNTGDGSFASKVSNEAATSWTFNSDPSENTDEGNFASKIGDHEATPWSFGGNASENSGDGNFVNKVEDNAKAMTLDDRIAQYEKYGLTVKYSKDVSANNPLKLMYANALYNDKPVKEIIDGTDFQVTFVNAPKNALSITPTYDANGVMTGFEETVY